MCRDQHGFDCWKNFRKKFHVRVLRCAQKHHGSEIQADNDAAHSGTAQLALAAV
jgi:hypothetical protein